VIIDFCGIKTTFLPKFNPLAVKVCGLNKINDQIGNGSMGAWGIHTFEDDHSLDWLNDLADQEQPARFFAECLDLEDDDELEYMGCTGVWCTAVMIDGLLNGPTKDLPEPAREWLDSHNKVRVMRLLPAAIAGLERLLDPSSELTALWMENEELYPKWRRGIVSLRNRLKKSGQKDKS
jgi:hypothetical protein